MQEQDSDQEIQLKQQQQNNKSIQNITSSNKSMIQAVVILCIVFILLLIIAIVLFLVFSFQNVPKIYLQNQYRHVLKQKNIYHEEQIYLKPQIIQRQSQKQYIQFPIYQNKYQNINIYSQFQHLLKYQSYLRKLDYQSIKNIFNPYSKDLIKDSQIRYNQYQRAIALLQLNIHLNQNSSLNQIINQERYYYQQKWKIRRRKQGSFCILHSLTKQGISSGHFLLSLLSIFHQNYDNYKLIVIDNSGLIAEQDNIIAVLNQLGKKKVVYLKGELSNIGVHYFAIHKYCKNTNYIIQIKDTGELIGKQVLALLNQIHTQKNKQIVISDYLFDEGQAVAKLSQGNYRYKLIFSLPQLEKTYRTKYLKSISTKIIMSLPQNSFKDQNGNWIKQISQFLLQLSVIERYCGEYFHLKQILYKASKNEIEKNSMEINDLNKKPKLKCMNKTNNLTPQYSLVKQFEHKLIGQHNISGLGQEQIYKIVNQLQNKFMSYYNKITYIISVQKETLQKYKQLNITFKNQQSKLKIRILQQIKAEYQIRKYIQSGFINNKQTSNKLSLSSPQQMKYCIIFTSQNQQQLMDVLLSIQSIVNQNYHSYRLVLLTTPHMSSFLKYYLSLKQVGIKNKLFLYQSTSNINITQILYSASRMFCKNGQIFILMKPGDELIGNKVLSDVNTIYQDKKVLSVYTNRISLINQSLTLPFDSIYDPEILKNNKFRQHQLLFTQLRTFYVDILWKINKVDFLQYNNVSWMDKGGYEQISYYLLSMICNKIYFLNQFSFKSNTVFQHYYSGEAKIINLTISEQQKISSKSKILQNNIQYKDSKNKENIFIQAKKQVTYQCLQQLHF